MKLLYFSLAAAATAEFSVFNGKYSDPNHPGCDRQVSYEGNNVGSISGADAAGGEGAACDGVTDIAWGPLPAKIDTTKIVADFSSKGGPSELSGVYSLSAGAIEWEDGNSWPKLKVVESIFNGLYSDPNHPSCHRGIIYTDDNTGSVYGSDSAAEGVPCDGNTDTPWGPLPATITDNVIVVDFSTKGGPSDLKGEYNEQKAAVDWEDGNSWPKLTNEML